jgi:hypothetical protein
MKLVKYPIYLCVWLFICIILTLGGITGIIWSITVDSNFYCEKLNNCTYYIVNYGCDGCQQCTISIPDPNCLPYPMDDTYCPNTTICYADSRDHCPLPNADSYECRSLLPDLCMVFSGVLLSLMIISLIFIIHSLYKNAIEYTKLINKSTGVINECLV